MLTSRLLISRRLLGLIVLSTLMAIGCGLADYEKHMIESQKRAARWDEEQKVLGEPLIAPLREENKAKIPVAKFFLRPPKGFSAQCVNEKDPEKGLYRYTPPKPAAVRGAPPVLTTPLASEAFAEITLAFAKADDKEFVKKLLAIYSAKDAAKKRPMKVENRDLLYETYEAESAEGTYIYAINIWRGPNAQVAIIYCYVKARRGAVAKTIDMSLESFGWDLEGDKLREQFNRGTPWRLTGPPSGG